MIPDNGTTERMMDNWKKEHPVEYRWMKISSWFYDKTYPFIGKPIFELQSWWHLKVKKRPQLWKDASQEMCDDHRYCMYCGKMPKK